MAILDKGRGGYRVFVGDLGSRVGKYDLEREFSYIGEITDVWVARNPPGFAFLVYRHGDDAERAVRKLHGRMVCGRRVRVEHARPYQERAAAAAKRADKFSSNEYHYRSHSHSRSRSKSRSLPRRRSRSSSRKRRHHSRSTSKENRHKKERRSYSQSTSRSRSPTKSRSKTGQSYTSRTSKHKSHSYSRSRSRSTSRSNKRKKSRTSRSSSRDKKKLCRRSRSGSFSKSKSPDHLTSPVNGKDYPTVSQSLSQQSSKSQDVGHTARSRTRSPSSPRKLDREQRPSPSQRRSSMENQSPHKPSENQQSPVNSSQCEGHINLRSSSPVTEIQASQNTSGSTSCDTSVSPTRGPACLSPLATKCNGQHKHSTSSMDYSTDRADDSEIDDRSNGFNSTNTTGDLTGDSSVLDVEG